MSFVDKVQLGTWVDFLTTQLNSLANNTLCSLGSIAINNVIGGGGFDGYILGDVELILGTPGGTTVAGSISLWPIMLGSDGSTYEYSAATPAAPVLCEILVPAISAGANFYARDVILPIGVFKGIAKNNLGQALAASGNKIRLLPKTIISV